MMYVAASVVTDKQTHTQTEYCNPVAHARRGLTMNAPLSVMILY